MQAAILCTGPSMSQAVADSVRSLQIVVAVNDTFRLAPWASALIANDAGWWRHRPDAKQFEGRKFCSIKTCGEIEVPDHAETQLCSGVVGLEVARMMGATKIILLGADMHGTHYFGPYTGTLRNTTPDRRKHHAVQFKRWGAANKGVQVWNATEGSALQCFPMKSLEACLAEFAIHAD